MPFNPDGSFSLTQDFGTGTPPSNDFPPQVGSVLDDIATALGSASSDNPYLVKDQNLSDVADVTTSQQNLGVEPGVDVQAFDAQLTAKIRMNIITSSYTLALTDAEKCILIQTNSGGTITIPANATVSLGQGTAVTFASFGSGSWFLKPAGGVTLTWSPSLGSGQRTLAVGATATVLALFDDYWVLTGGGIT